uniref:FHA domain-containing protein n=1 Tax=Oryza meridionalis TaxID=40149 RepID=A0A0E0E8P3_9ORYZ
MASAGRNRGVGFAKLQGEDFEYFMQTYSIILGRDSKKEKVDLDISGGDLTISRHHAHIFYDFERKWFSLQVLGKNGCTVEGVLHLPGGSPIKLDSQDLLQIGQKKFYFLLPTRSIFGTSSNQHGPSASAAFQPANNGTAADEHNLTASAAAQPAHICTAAPPHIGTAQPGQIGIVTLPPAHIQNNAENENIAGIETQEEFMNHNKMPFGELDTCSSHHITIEPTLALGGQPVNNLAIRPADNNKDHQQEVLLKEEEYVLASIGIVISDLCGLKKMIPIEKLHSELVACYGATWPQRQVQMHLAPEAGSSAAGTECKPWLKLMYLLRKYPERFTVMNSSCDEEGQATSVYVTLNSLWPC